MARQLDGSDLAEAVPAAVLSEPDDVFPQSESISKVFLKAFLCGQRGFASLSTYWGSDVGLMSHRNESDWPAM